MRHKIKQLNYANVQGTWCCYPILNRINTFEEIMRTFPTLYFFFQVRFDRSRMCGNLTTESLWEIRMTFMSTMSAWGRAGPVILFDKIQLLQMQFAHHKFGGLPTSDFNFFSSIFFFFGGGGGPYCSSLIKSCGKLEWHTCAAKLRRQVSPPPSLWKQR
jgi:hypothetical protein